MAGPSDSKAYDLVVYGATSFTGNIVCEYLLKEYGAEPSDFKWAVAGRNKEKLGQLKADLGEQANDVPVIIADSDEPDTLERMCQQAKCIITTVGPYSLYGNDLVAAAVRNGVHCCDLTGESPWVRDMIDRHHEEAERTGAKIVCSCGYDSVPADLGAFMMREHLKDKYGKAMRECKSYMAENSADTNEAGLSGGTSNSIEVIAKMMWEGGMKTIKQLSSPLYLTTSDTSAPLPEGLSRSVTGFGYDKDANKGKGGWTGPMPLANHDAKIVQRSSMLLGGYGGADKPCSYSNSILMPGKIAGFFAGLALTSVINVFSALFFLPLTRPFVRKLLPATGSGPSKKYRESSKWFLDFVARSYPGEDGKEVAIRGRVGSDKGDMGYNETAKMLCESGLGLVLGAQGQEAPSPRGGVLAPASALGHVLLARLRAKGMTFEVTEG